MNRRTALLVGSFAAAILATPAWGQAKKPVRTGTATSAPPPQPIVVNTTGFPTVPTPTTQTGPSTAPVNGTAQITQLSYYPTLVLADGRVLANFGTGRGYEEVLRQCPQLSGQLPPNATFSACWTVDAYGAYRVMQRR
jgi:hypothetical protein